MPISKYKKEKSGLYYTYEKTGMFKPDGTPEYKKIRAKTIKLLDEKIKQYHEQAAFGVEPSTLTVDQWFSQWFVSYKGGLRESTKNFYLSLYKTHISPKIGAMRITQVKELNCQAILTEMSESHSVKTIKSVRTTLYSLFDKAQANKIIVTNPAARLKAEGKASKKRRALTPEERTAYLKACKTHPFGEFAAVLYFFGLRRGEALALTKADIHEDYIGINKQISYPGNNRPVMGEPKTRAGIRDIPIPHKARNYIDFDSFDDGLLFCREDGTAYSYSEIVDRWNSFITAALGKDTDITEHCLRHNYCTMLFECGADPLAAQELMGHEDPKTTLGIYTHFTAKIKENNTAKVLKIG